MMRRSLFPIAAVLATAFSACGQHSAGTLPSLAPIANAPGARGAAGAANARGSVISVRYVTRFTKRQMNGDLGLEGQVITQLGGKPVCDVDLYAIVYRTIGTRGEPADASEGFFVPGRACKPPFLLVGYGQGTNTVKAMKMTQPSAKNIEPVSLASIYAAHGYAMAATDYLGLGYSTYSFQPYLVGRSEASAIIDAMRAARTVAAQLSVPLAPKVFLTGYSQGGHSILSAQKVIEAENAREFHIVANSPGSGLYALERTTLDLLGHPGPLNGDPVLWAYMLTAYQKTYGNVYTTPAHVFRNPYAASVENLLPVDTYAQNAALNGTTLPLSTARLLHAAFRNAFAGTQPVAARNDVVKNDLLHGWTPKAPVYLCAGSRDPVVEYKNSELAFDYFRRKGATVSLIDLDSFMPPQVPLSQYHDAVLVLCHTWERVKILDGANQRSMPGAPHYTARGRIGPFVSSLVP